MAAKKNKRRTKSKLKGVPFRTVPSIRDDVVKLASELISIRTVNPPGENYEKIVSLLEERCKRLGMKTKRVLTPKSELKKHGVLSDAPRINLIADWDRKTEKTLHINGHYDVVPVTSNWKTDPFKPVVKRGRLYGRGAEDMKGNIAAALIAIKTLKENKLNPGCNIQLSFTPDEETGGRTGFGYIVEKGLIKADYAISEGYRNDYISYGNKGLIWFKIDIKGRASHSSEPHLGINAFEKMVYVASALLELNKKISKRKTRYKVKEPANRISTMVLGGELEGGAKTNVVPDSCSFTIDRRFLPEENVEQVKKEVISVIDKLNKKDPALKAKVTVLAEEDSVASDESSKLFTVFKKSVRKVLNKQPKCALLSGATDIRFIIRKGIPCVGYTVDGASSNHCDNEFVYIKSLVNTTKILADVIYNLR